MQKWQKATKKCPRCRAKLNASARTCPFCELSFAKFEMATCKEGKKRLKNHEKDLVIYSTSWPSDINYIKFVLLTIFGGLFGAHYFKAGRYYLGLYMVFASIILVIFASLNSQIVKVQWLASLFSIIVGVQVLLYFTSAFLVILKRFKFPVSLATNSEIAKEIIEETKKN